jgi:acyl carrier protein
MVTFPSGSPGGLWVRTPASLDLKARPQPVLTRWARQIWKVAPAGDRETTVMSDLEILRGYIRNETGYEGELDPELDLLEKQVLDSFSIVQWAMFIQERFAIELEAEELVRDNLSSFSKVMALIQSKKSAGVAQGETRS